MRLKDEGLGGERMEKNERGKKRGDANETDIETEWGEKEKNILNPRTRQPPKL